MVDWVQTFTEKICETPSVRKCTLTGDYQHVSRLYRHNRLQTSIGLINGRLFCSNSCSVTITFQSTSLGLDGATFQYHVHGHADHVFTKPRQLRGAARLKEVARNFSSPSERRNQLINELGKYSTRVPTTDVITKARSELRCQLRGSAEWMEELRCLHSSMQPTFIRSIEVIPMKLLLWSERMLDCYRQKTNNFGRTNLYMDATGGKVRKIDNKPVLMVSLIMSSVQEDRPQIPVAMMLTNHSDSTVYTNFLQRWWASINSVKTAKPAAVIIDKNWPSIHAVTLVFNGMDIIQYIRMCFDVVEGRYEGGQIDEITILGLARSHTVKNIVRWESMKSNNHSIQLWWKYAVVHFVTITSWDHLKRYIRSLFCVLLIPNSCDVHFDLEFVSSGLSDEIDVHNEGTTKPGDEIEIIPAMRLEAIYQQSPFHSLGKAIFEEISQDHTEDFETTNPRRNPDLVADIMKRIMPYISLISGIMHCPSRYARNASIKERSSHQPFNGWRESYVEAWHSILKNQIFRDFDSILPQEFVRVLDAITERSM